MGRIMKWWCRLTVRWWTPGSSTSKAPPFPLTSEISRGIRPTPSLAPLQQPQRQPTLSAPSPSHYSSAQWLRQKTRSGTLAQWRASWRNAVFCLRGRNSGGKRRKEKLLCTAHLLGKHWSLAASKWSFCNGECSPESSVTWCSPPPPPTVPFQAVSILLCLNTCLLSNEILSPFLPFHLLVHSKVIFI